jgi:hypothetical protein
MSNITLKSMKGMAIVNNISITNATVSNTLNVETYLQPSYSYGSFSSGSMIPLGISTGSLYKTAEIKINFIPANNTNINITSKDTSNAIVSLIEPSEIIFKTTPVNGSTASVITTNTGTLMLTAGSESALVNINIVKGLNRNHYSADSVYTYVGVGASRSMAQGYFNTSALGSISLKSSGGNFTGNYSVIKYY